METKDKIASGTDKRSWCVYLYMFPDGMFYYGKSYVGGLEKRHRDHAYGCYDIGVWIRLWRGKGVEVKPEPVEFFGSEDAALVREQELIEETDAVNKGLNMCEGGGQPPTFWGEKHPMKRPEVRAKVGLARRGKYAGEKCYWYGKEHTEETRKKISEAKKGQHAGEKHPMFGKKHSEETRAKMSAAQNKRFENPDARARVSADMKRLWADHAYQANMLVAMRTPEYRARKAAAMSGANNPWFGKKHSEEMRAKRSAALKRAYADPVLRAKKSADMKKICADPAVRAKRSADMKRVWAERKAAKVGCV